MTDDFGSVVRRAHENHILVYKERFSNKEIDITMNPDLSTLGFEFSAKPSIMAFSANNVTIDEAQEYRFARHILVDKRLIWEVLTVGFGDSAVCWKVVMPFELGQAVDNDLKGVKEAIFPHRFTEWEKLFLNYKDRHLAVAHGRVAASQIEMKDEQISPDSYMYRIDGGALEYGFEDEETHEYFLNGDLFQGRIVVKRLSRNKIKLNEDAKKRLSDAGEQWIFQTPKRQVPMIFTKKDKLGLLHTTSKRIGRSYLPKAIRDRIPDELRYWEGGSPDLLEQVRNRVDEFVTVPERENGQRKVDM